MERVRILNVKVDNLTMHESLERINELIAEKNNAYVVTPNLDHLVRLDKDRKFQQVYNEAALVLPDGKPLIWFSKLFKKPLKEKVSGSDLMPRLAKMCAEKGYSMFLLGAAEGVAVKAAEKLELKYPGLSIVGTYSPPLGFEKDINEVSKIINMVRKASPDVLIVGLGSPKQEYFMNKYRKKLQVPVSLGLGASIDFEAGEKKRAPKWMSKIGLEWLYRLLQEPKRLFKRYFFDAICIVPLMIKYR